MTKQLHKKRGYSVIIFMSAILCFLFMGFSVKAANNIPIPKTAGTMITVPTYSNHDTLVITGDTLEAADWPELKALTIVRYHLNVQASNKEVPKGALAGSRILSIKCPEVISIGDSAFKECSSLTSLILPELTLVGDSAFWGCSQLGMDNFPKVVSIGKAAFSFCRSLVSVTFPQAVSIGDSAFRYCTFLASVTFPEVTDIGEFAFYGCSNLTSVIFPKATSIGSFAFSFCDLLSSVTLSEVTSIGRAAFSSCDALTSVSFPKATLVDSTAFYASEALVSVNLPEVTSLKLECFAACYALSSVNIPKVTSIGHYAFLRCTTLTSISIPQVTSIGELAFYNCKGLESIVLGATPPSVHYNAFYGIPTLEVPAMLLIVPDSNAYTSTMLSSYPAGTEAFNKTVTIESDTIVPGTPYDLIPNRIPTLTGGSYQWYKDGSPIPGVTGTVYQATDAGTYTLRYYRGGEWVELLAKHLVSDAIDLYGTYWRYQDCENILRLSFLPSAVDREVEVWSEGDGAAYLFDMDTEKYFKDKLTYKLAANDSIVTIRYMIDEHVVNGSEADLFYQLSGGAVTKAEELTLYAMPEIKLLRYHPATAQYDGVLDISIEKGPSHILCSLDGGVTWQFARDTVTGKVIPFTKSEIDNFIPGSTILFRVPNGCRMEALTVGESGEVPPLITRPVTMPSVPNAISTVAPGQYYVLSGTNFEFTLTPTGSNIGKVLHVTTSRTTIPDSEGVKIVDNRDGSFTVTILNIKEPVVISVDFATGIDSVDKDAVWSYAGQLNIHPEISGEALIYSVSGLLVKTVFVEAGETVSVPLNRGLYMVTLNGKVYKVILK